MQILSILAAHINMHTAQQSTKNSIATTTQSSFSLNGLSVQLKIQAKYTTLSHIQKSFIESFLHAGQYTCVCTYQ